MKQRFAYAALKVALRLCRWSRLQNPKGLVLDAAGDIGWRHWSLLLGSHHPQETWEHCTADKAKAKTLGYDI